MRPQSILHDVGCAHRRVETAEVVSAAISSVISTAGVRDSWILLAGVRKRHAGLPLQRLRSERVERTFAHLCDTGGSRRSWLRGIEEVRKRYLMAATAYNLGRILRRMLGAGKTKHLAVLAARLFFALFTMPTIWLLLHGIRVLLARLRPRRALLAN